MRRFGTVICSVGSATVLFLGQHGMAAPSAGAPNDWEMATIVVGKDTPREIEQKLGISPCLVPADSGGTVSYLYKLFNGDEQYFLRLEVDIHVDAISVSKDPPLTGVCYAPLTKPISLQTQKGLRLGARIEEVKRLYGKPPDVIIEGPLTRFRYIAESYEWDLVFRNGRLVEWSVRTEE